jgi:hypothetical protein
MLVHTSHPPPTVLLPAAPITSPPDGRSYPTPKRSSWLYAWWGVVLAPVLGLFLMLVLAAFSDLPGTEDLENPTQRPRHGHPVQRW